MVLMTAMFGLSATVARAGGLAVTINGNPGDAGPPGASLLISANEVADNVDVAPQPGQPQPVVSGMSVKLVAELAGVAPDRTLENVEAGGPGAQYTGTFGPGPKFAEVNPSQTVSGYPFDGFAYYATFANGSLGTELDVPSLASGTLVPYYVELYDAANGGTVPVNISVKGVVLGVPQPVFDVCTPGVDQSVGFSLPAGGVVTLGQQPGAPADTDGPTYSWDFGDGSPATALSSSDAATHAFASPGTYDVRLTAVDGANNAGVSPVAAQVVVGTSQGVPGACGQVPGAGGSPTGGHGGNHAGSPSSGSKGAPATGGGTGGPSGLSSGAATGSVHATTTKTAPRKTGPAPTSAVPAPSAANGSATSGGGNGSGHGGSGGVRSGGGAAGSHGAGAAASGAAGGYGVTGRPASGAVVSGSGAGRTKPPTRSAHTGAPAPANLTGLLIESLGSPVSGGLASASSNPLSLLQSVARASSGDGGSGGLPAWILGVVSLVALFVVGVVRESGPGVWKWLGTHRRSGSGHLHAGAA
jgi:hypothetical protein